MRKAGSKLEPAFLIGGLNFDNRNLGNPDECLINPKVIQESLLA